MKRNIDESYFVKVCQEAQSMASAASTLKMHFNTFKRIAVRLNCYRTNQSGKGIKRKSTCGFSTMDILNGKHPQYQTNKLKKRLIKEGIIENKCEKCNRPPIWNDTDLVLELNHKNGDSTDHRLDNLELLCPNCHSQTPTFRGANMKHLSALRETEGVELVKFGETLTDNADGNPEPSPTGKV